MLCVPTARAEVDSVATPLALSGDAASNVVPSRKLTVPVGAVVPDAGTTVAVNRMVWPNIDGFGDEISDVLVPIDVAITVCTMANDVLVRKLPSPLYTAVTAWLPAASDDVESDAVPLATAAVPREVEPSKNCTVPVAVDGDTAAVNVTACPVVDGLGDDVRVVVVVALLIV